MIGKIFLGKAWHWLLIAVAAGLLWYCGSNRLHVIVFNQFVLSLMAGTALAVLAVLWLHRDGEQITRDKLIETLDDDENSAASAAD